MSLWHSPQAAESMKKLEGMMPPTVVFADEGKNGDFGPPPSSSVDAGTTRGFWMRATGLRNSEAEAGKSTRTAIAARKAGRKRGVLHATGVKARTPSTALPMCSHKTHRCS